MKHLIATLALSLLATACTPRQTASEAALPWENGRLTVSPDGRYLQHENGTPFFWMGNTGWLLPERLTREEADFFLETCREAGYNVVQVQTVNGVPARNAYDKLSMPDGFDFSRIDDEGPDGYWQHMDYIIRKAEQEGIYIGMVCIWGGLVKHGQMNEEQAVAYGTFLADRYKDAPNIVWIIGGDIRGDIKTEVWEALARTIRAIDPHHLMTFHPYGRTSSTEWFHDADWLDFNMFQSGHRRYDQTRGDGDDRVQASLSEDNWRYVEAGLRMHPVKPILDAEPSYEEIPQGLHDPEEPWWKAPDARRYAYWSVFAGACGHTYGHNSIMQMHTGEGVGAYGARKSWREGLQDGGFNQMRYLKRLMLTFPYFERIGDQSVIAGENGFRYDRAIATRGDDYLLVYTYTNRPMQIDLGKISGEQKNVWWYSPTDGSLQYIGTFADGIHTFGGDGETGPGHDRVLIAADSRTDYIPTDRKSL
ncbi:MAG: glycoside hydrolase family 140 protein [Alistipes sp.]|nr:glycoside hydrolase family 140 protein [Alistipes sp.]